MNTTVAVSAVVSLLIGCTFADLQVRYGWSNKKTVAWIIVSTLLATVLVSLCLPS